MKKYLKGRKKRTFRVRSRIKKKENRRPRLSIFRSNRYLYAQIIDDQKGTVLVSASEKELKTSKEKKLTKVKRAELLGLHLGQKAKELKINTVSFDRNGYKYHGRVKAFAEGARSSGLKF